MTNYKDVKTGVLRSIMAAYTASYGRELTEEEKTECQKTIQLIKMELDARKNQQQKNNLINGDTRGEFVLASSFGYGI